jgi:hypothetical protein
VEPEELEETPKSLEEEMQANLQSPGAAEESKSEETPSIDIDLTADDDTLDEPPSNNAAIEGNFLFSAGAPAAPMMMARTGTGKIRIRITDAVLSSETHSPKSTPPHAGPHSESSPSVHSPTRTVPEGTPGENDSNPSPSATSVQTPNDSVNITEERMAVLKPRLVGRKLVNYPPKKTGKEVSGLCTIC